jgi:hypothetical protein
MNSLQGIDYSFHDHGLRKQRFSHFGFAGCTFGGAWGARQIEIDQPSSNRNRKWK